MHPGNHADDKQQGEKQPATPEDGKKASSLCGVIPCFATPPRCTGVQRTEKPRNETQAGSGTKPRNESRGVNRRRREFVSRPPTVVKISRRHAAPEATSSAAATPSSAVETTGREEQQGVGRPVAKRLCRFDGSKSTPAFHWW